MIEQYCGDFTAEKIASCGKKANSYVSWLAFYRDFLIQEAMKFFSWSCGDVPQEEIEIRLITAGKCGINFIKNADGLTACDVSLFGVTRYYDKFTSYNYSTPVDSGECAIGKNGILISGNALRIPSFIVINRYAMQLAHIKVSLVNALVNARSNVAYVCNTAKQAEGVRAYRNKLYNGSNDVIMDTDWLGIDAKDNAARTTYDFAQLNDLYKDTLLSFYKDMGVPNVHVKKERLIVSELEYENVLPKLNMKDAYDMRKRACDEINSLFGVDWEVKCNVEFEEKVEDGSELEESDEEEGEKK